MPKIIIHAGEKTALRAYIDSPLDYVDKRYHAYFVNNACPDQTKITRAFPAAKSKKWNRFFIVPIDAELGATIWIPISTIHAEDRELHACTYVSGKLFFHQNGSDLPEIQFKEVDLSCFDDSDSDVDEEYKQMQQRLKDAKLAQALRKDYLKNKEDQNLLKQVVKYAVDEQDNDYILKVTSSFVEQFIPFTLPKIRGNAHIVFFRISKKDNMLHRKRIEFQLDQGENLSVFIQSDPSFNELEQIACALLKGYVQQIFLQDIVHTDINSSNICIKRSENGFIVTYIDFDESFYSTDPQKSGRGTVGYYAPEFFLNPEICAKQFEIRAQSEALLVSVLKPNFQEFFSQASDIYALGCVLLNDLKLTENSVYYSFFQRMCARVPDDRPMAEEIINLLNANHSEQQINQIKHGL